MRGAAVGNWVGYGKSQVTISVESNEPGVWWVCHVRVGVDCWMLGGLDFDPP